MFRKAVLFLVLVFLAGASVALAKSADPKAPAADGTIAANVSFPQGNVDAGRLVFRAQKCFVCHEVAGLEGKGMKIRTFVPAPLLDSRLAKKDPGDVITAVIAPSHHVSELVAKQSGGKLSPMGDFTTTLTVRQLIDLVAFLRSIDETQTAAQK